MEKSCNMLNYSDVPNISKIDNHLYLGDHVAASDIGQLKSLNIKHIVQLFALDPDPELVSFISYLRIPIRGGKTTNIEPVVFDALRYIKSAISKQENVLVHCKHGRNRSASIVIAYIMTTKNYIFHQVYDYVHSIRPILRIKPRVKDFLVSPEFENIKRKALTAS